MADALSELEQLVLLALLRLGPDAYGVSITDEITTTAGRPMSIGAVYKALARLEERGHVEGRTGRPTPERGGRRKRHYRLRPAGREALAGALQAIRRMAHGIDGLIEGGP